MSDVSNVSYMSDYRYPWKQIFQAFSLPSIATLNVHVDQKSGDLDLVIQNDDVYGESKAIELTRDDGFALYLQLKKLYGDT